MDTEQPHVGRRRGDRSPHQKQLDTEALVLASRAFQASQDVDRRSAERFETLQMELTKMEAARIEQHKENREGMVSLQRAMWTAATGLIGVLGTTLLYFLSQHH